MSPTDANNRSRYCAPQLTSSMTMQIDHKPVLFNSRIMGSGANIAGPFDLFVA